jgi:sulfoxide reductase heme-binding subunit YedZ
LSLLGLAVVASIVTFAGEAVGIAIAFHVSPLLVLGTIFDFDAGIRPGWHVLGAGLVVVVIDAVVGRWKARTARTRAVAAG